MTGLVHINDTDLIAFAQDPQGIVLDISEIQTDELGDSKAAVQEQCQYAIISFLIFSVNSVQQLETFFQSQIFGERAHLLGASIS